MKFLSLAFGVSVGVAIFLGVQWYLYATRIGNPHDDFGTELNSYMPGPLNAWACGRLKQRFPDALPPEGCIAEDGRSWRGIVQPSP